LREILKNTPENHPDCETIPKAMKLIQQFGKSENRFGLEMLEKKLTFNKKHMLTQEIVSIESAKLDVRLRFMWHEIGRSRSAIQGT